MYCPFQKRIDYYDFNGIYHTKRQEAMIQKESFCNCDGSECMAYDRDAFGKPYCKLIEKKN